MCAKKFRPTPGQWREAIAQRKKEEQERALPHPVVFPADELPDKKSDKKSDPQKEK